MAAAVAVCLMLYSCDVGCEMVNVTDADAMAFLIRVDVPWRARMEATSTERVLLSCHLPVRCAKDLFDTAIFRLRVVIISISISHLQAVIEDGQRNKKVMSSSLAAPLWPEYEND